MGSAARKGDVAGCINAGGYVVIRVDGVLYRANRLAWLLMTGAWPDGTIDHKDGDRSNDRWRNLRDVPHLVNMQNLRAARADNKTGLLGVCIDKDRGKFKAQIRIDGRNVLIGRFDSAQAAYSAYIDAKRKHHAGCTL